MTVKELIEYLKTASQDREVVFMSDKEVFTIGFIAEGTLNLNEVVFISEKRYHN